MTLDEVKERLTRIGLRFQEKSAQELVFGFKTENYVNPAGHKTILLCLHLIEDGKYLRLFAPLALTARGAHPDAFFRACMMAQWRTKLVQFEYDDRDGEICPIVEFPIEDGTVTVAQLERCVRGLASLVDGLYPVLKRALDEGVVEFEPPPPATARREIEAIDTLIDALLAQPGRDEPLLASLRARRASLAGEPGSGPPTSV